MSGYDESSGGPTSAVGESKTLGQSGERAPTTIGIRKNLHVDDDGEMTAAGTLVKIDRAMRARKGRSKRWHK